MMPPPDNHPSDPPPDRAAGADARRQDERRDVVELEAEAAYSIDVVARVSGVSAETILHFHQHGLIAPAVGEAARGECFDDETVHRVRRIEYLRSCYGMQLAAIKLTLDLMDELEQLRAELRARG